LHAAFDAFLTNGFAATTLEQIAHDAEVSRQTIYAYFGGSGDGVKEAVFAAMVESRVSDADRDEHRLVEQMPASEDLERDLTEFARHHVHLVLAPQLVRLRRIILGEAERFPPLAQTWFEHGPRASYDLFARWFAALHQRSLLHAPDPLVAAQMFNWLVLSAPLNEAMARSDASTTIDLDRHAAEAVRVFLAAYGHDAARDGDR
jgi:AcrR family transcriptional regulator